MNHKRQYNLLVEKYKKLDLKKSSNNLGGLENHHIVPKSLGGSNKPENMVLLTAKAHFVAHHLLHKIYGGQMTYAYVLILNTMKDVKITSRVYEVLKRDYGKLVSKQFKGNTHNVGRKFSPDQIEQHSIRMSGERNPMFGRKHKQSTKEKIRQKAIGRKHSPEQILQQSASVRSAGPNKSNTSGVKGVRWVKNDKRWRAEIKTNNKAKHLGQFISFNDAVIARWTAELELGFPIIIF